MPWLQLRHPYQGQAGATVAQLCPFALCFCYNVSEEREGAPEEAQKKKKKKDTQL